MKILVIRRDNIGDLVCATPLLAALRRRYPEGHIAALVNSYNAGVLAGNPDVDAVHVYTKLKHRARGESWFAVLARRFRTLAALRREGFEYVVLAKSGFDKHGLALARRIRPRQIVGFAAPSGREGKEISVPLAPLPYDELHEVEVMMKLGAPLGVESPPGAVRIFPSSEHVAAWRERFPQFGQRAARPWIALHISTRLPNRVWPVEKFVGLARDLSPQAGIVLLWAPGAADDPRHPGDDESAAAFATSAGAQVRLIPAKTESLADLVAVLSLCDGFIGVDGGAMHVAAALGLPVVALFENLPAKKRHWHPWKVPHEIVSPETRDIADIPVDQVVQAWSRLAARRS
jgi:ADP-heptose:LPS heptosyltransferase